ncbi:MAG: putative porin [Candidatus Methylacidiphilales bacterium]
MKSMRWALALMLGACATLTGVVSAKEFNGSPLVDALVKKGVLTSEEAEEVTYDLQKQYESTGGGMLSWGSSSVKGVKIYGDVRLRYQYTGTEGFNGNPSDRDAGAFRYRMRVGADYKFTDNFSAGVRFATNVGENSTNITMNSFLSGREAIQVDLYYLTYKNSDFYNTGWVNHFEVGVGKHKQAFMIDGAFWDSDINPEGAYVEAGWKGVGHQSIDVQARGAAYILEGAFTDTEGAADQGHDFLFAVQTDVKYSWGKKNSATIAPSFWVSSGGDNETGQPSLTFPTSGAPAGTRNGFKDFGVLYIPVEVKFEAWKLPHTVFGGYGINVLADGSNNGIANNARGIVGTQNQMFQVGYKVGSARKKGGWQLGGDYRYIEADAWSTALSDSDFGASDRNNVHGFTAKGTYAFTDFLTGSVTYLKSWNINTSAALNGRTDSADVIQADLAWKF